jgi:hypothetical protein
MLIETHKTEGRQGTRTDPDPLDVMNLEALRVLRGSERPGIAVPRGRRTRPPRTAG